MPSRDSASLLDTAIAEGPQIVTKRGVETAVLLPIEQWRKLERMTKPDLKELLLASEFADRGADPATATASPPNAFSRGVGPCISWIPTWSRNSVVPVHTVPFWTGSANVPDDQLFVSAVTIAEIQAGVEITREQDAAKAEELETWLDKILASYGVCRWTPWPSGSGHASCTEGPTP